MRERRHQAARPRPGPAHAARGERANDTLPGARAPIEPTEPSDSGDATPAAVAAAEPGAERARAAALEHERRQRVRRRERNRDAARARVLFAN